MQATRRVTGLILAGGAGRRVDGEDKGLLVWKNQSLVGHVINRLSPQVDQLLISCNRNFPEYEKFSIPLVKDQRAGFEGPLAGIEAAIPFIETPYLVVVACDVPEIPRDLVHRLCRPLFTQEISSPIQFANDGSRDQYLCAAMKTGVLESLPKYLASGRRTVWHWYRDNGATALDFSDKAQAFKNYNYTQLLAED